MVVMARFCMFGIRYLMYSMILYSAQILSHERIHSPIYLPIYENSISGTRVPEKPLDIRLRNVKVH